LGLLHHHRTSWSLSLEEATNLFGGDEEDPKVS